MLEQNDVNKIKESVEEFFEKMTIDISDIEVSSSFAKKNIQETNDSTEENRDIVDLNIKLNEPQILIGQQGQTLFEIQRLLKTVLNRRLSRSQSPDKVVDSRRNQSDQISSTESGQKIFYLNLDINEYKKKKTEYLKDLAKNSADQVSLIKEEKEFLPMPAYERRIIHSELSQRTDVITESRGDGFNRHIVIRPK